MKPIRPCGLVNIPLMQLDPYNFSVREWKVTVSTLVVLRLRGLGTPRFIINIKDSNIKLRLERLCFGYCVMIPIPIIKFLGNRQMGSNARPSLEMALKQGDGSSVISQMSPSLSFLRSTLYKKKFYNRIFLHKVC